MPMIKRPVEEAIAALDRYKHNRPQLNTFEVQAVLFDRLAVRQGYTVRQRLEFIRVNLQRVGRVLLCTQDVINVLHHAENTLELIVWLYGDITIEDLSDTEAQFAIRYANIRQRRTA